MELNWSRLGKVSCSQYHCATAASTSEVGVSALYSRSFGGPAPSYARSNRPYKEGGSASQEASMSGTASAGIDIWEYSLLSMTCWAAASVMASSSFVAASSAST